MRDFGIHGNPRTGTLGAFYGQILRTEISSSGRQMRRFVFGLSGRSESEGWVPTTGPLMSLGANAGRDGAHLADRMARRNL